jgi:hypothetical protein
MIRARWIAGLGLVSEYDRYTIARAGPPPSVTQSVQAVVAVVHGAVAVRTVVAESVTTDRARKANQGLMRILSNAGGRAPARADSNPDAM